MDEIKYIVRTTMEKEDYRKFLYLATFCKNKMVVPMIACLAFAGSLVLNWNLHDASWGIVMLYWVFLFVLAIAVVCLKVERKNKLRVTTDNTGTFGSLNVLKFYSDKVVMDNASLKSTGELKYSQFYSVVESKDYLIFYITANQASLIRKKDVEYLEPFKQFIKETFVDKYRHI
ncbi:MAG: rane associated protein [Oscillospiraceae bacterium]|jgi:hypothetical protein|nr:rane associated protein [Oscillospiraceae bacterium]